MTNHDSKILTMVLEAVMCRDVASGTDRHLAIPFGLQLVESSSLVSILLEKRLAIHTSPFFIY